MLKELLFMGELFTKSLKSGYMYTKSGLYKLTQSISRTLVKTWDRVMWVVILLIVLSTVGSANEKHFYGTERYTHGVIVKIVDGDTIRIYAEGKMDNHRLAYIDTPESYMNTKAQNNIRDCRVQPYIMMHLGLTAKDYLLDNYPVGTEVEFRVVGKGYYKRNLIVVTGLNTKLVKLGLAVVYTDNIPNDISEEYFRLENNARLHKIGVWRYLKKSCL